MDSSVSLPTFRFQSQDSSSNLKPISASASYQSHISSRHAQPRLRSSRLGKMSDIPFVASPTSRSFVWTVSSWVGLSRRSNHRSWWIWLIWAYCCVSVVLFTRKMYAEIVMRIISHEGTVFSYIRVARARIHRRPVHVASPSPLDFLSTDDRLFKLTSVRPIPDGFHPYYFHHPTSGAIDSNGITACAWMHMDELSNRTSVNHLKQWAKSWSGMLTIGILPP